MASEIEEMQWKKIEELRSVVETQKGTITLLTRDLTEARELVSYMNNKDRMARDNAEMLQRIKKLKERFRDTAGAMETAIKLAIDPTADDLSKVILEEPLPTLLKTRYLG